MWRGDMSPSFYIARFAAHIPVEGRNERAGRTFY